MYAHSIQFYRLVVVKIGENMRFCNIFLESLECCQYSLGRSRECLGWCLFDWASGSNFQWVLVTLGSCQVDPRSTEPSQYIKFSVFAKVFRDFQGSTVSLCNALFLQKGVSDYIWITTWHNYIRDDKSRSRKYVYLLFFVFLVFFLKRVTIPL
jgi:hypothetical protein